MANSESIKKYLIEGKKAYLEDDANNGNILMLSGAWGSGKTHFWNNVIETDLVPKTKAKKKSYVFVTLYGKDSIEELQTEILQKSYDFIHHKKTDVVSQAYSVFTKATSFMPKITVFGVGIDATGTSKQIEELNNSEKLKKGTEALLNGGVICFDDFERKSSKIDLNDLFGFITNLTENFQTKTIIILNQEFFQDHDTKVFNTVKEKSVNKFILYDPTIEELFDVIYQDEKYQSLNTYKTTILDAIKLSEEKNARIYIQVLNNCLEYVEKIKDVNERAIYLLVLTTIIFIKYNLLIHLSKTNHRTGFYKNNKETYIFPDFYNELPEIIFNSLLNLEHTIPTKQAFLNILKRRVEIRYSPTDGKTIPAGILDHHFEYIEDNQNMLFIIYKYFLFQECFSESDIEIVNQICSFVESGILFEG